MVKARAAKGAVQRRKTFMVDHLEWLVVRDQSIPPGGTNKQPILGKVRGPIERVKKQKIAAFGSSYRERIPM